MEEEMQWATSVVNKKAELDKRTEHRRGRALKLGHIKPDSPGEEEERSVANIQAEERERRTSSDFQREIVDLGGAETLTELHRRIKSKKKTGSSPRVSVEMPVLGPVDTSDFMKAAVQGKLKVVKKFLEDGGDPNVCDEFRRTALHRASIEGHSTVVQKLLEKGADINFKDRLDSRAVHWACRGGRLGVLKVLQSHGADLNVRDKLMSTPLHVATRTGHADIVEYLLSSGVKINAKDREGDTALHDAVHLNRFKIVKLLIVGGADMKVKNAEGATAVEQVKQWQFDTKETLERLEQLREVGLVPS